MIRVVTAAQAEVIGEAYSRIPARLMPLAEQCDFFCGDPYFAGVHGIRGGVNDAGQKFHTGKDAHAAYWKHTRDKRTTIVLPTAAPRLSTVLHELGHAVQYAVGDRLGWPKYEGRGWPWLQTINWYSESSYSEAWAEAWLQWFYPPEMVEGMCGDDAYQQGSIRKWVRWSRANTEVFNRLLAE